MDSERRNLLLLLTFAVIAAIAIWQFQQPQNPAVAISDVDDTTPFDAGLSLIQTKQNQSGPAYLTYNTPWAFAPPVQNFLPKTTVGQIGEVAGQGPNPNQEIVSCGCDDT